MPPRQLQAGKLSTLEETHFAKPRICWREHSCDTALAGSDHKKSCTPFYRLFRSAAISVVFSAIQKIDATSSR